MYRSLWSASRPSSSPIVALLALCLLLGGSLLADEAPVEPAKPATYTLKFASKTPAVGDRFHYRQTDTTVTDSKITFPSGESMRNDGKVRDKFEATYVVDAVEDDEITKATWTVIRAERREDGETITIAEPGTIVSTDRVDGKSRLTIGELVLLEDQEHEDEETETMHEFLEHMIGMDDPDLPSDDAVFGPKRPVAVGETWPIDEVLAMRAARTILGDATLKSLNGSTTLDSVDLDATPATFTASYAMNLAVSDFGDEEVEIDAATMTIKMSAIFAFDANVYIPQREVADVVTRTRGIFVMDGQRLDVVMRETIHSVGEETQIME